MPIKTRAEIYGMEASELLREISMYPGLTGEQLCRFHPGKEDKVKTLLSHLKKQGRITQDESNRFIPNGGSAVSIDQNLTKAVWVLLDFIDRVDFHSACDFPVKISFFAQGEEYEIIYVPFGQEGLITQALHMLGKFTARRIVIVDAPDQISALDLPDVSGYCMVAGDGRVSYYQKRNGGTT